MSGYERVAPVYDALGDLYSGGAIRRAKMNHLRFVESGQRVLYPGCGTAEEAAAAARSGVNVTLLDTSERMLARAARRFEAEGLRVKVHREAFEEHHPDRPYDAVVASFFFNVFSTNTLDGALETAARLVAPRGKLVIVDFAAAPSSRALEVFRKVHYLPPLTLFRLVTGNPWHELYDYEARITRHGLPFGAPERIVERAWGLPLYEACCFERLP